MFDKNGFFYTKQLGFDKYNLDVGASSFLNLENNEYVVFQNNRFIKKNTNQLTNKMFLLTELENYNLSFDEQFFKYGLVYYQKNQKDANIKGGDLDSLDLFLELFEDFGLQLKFREKLEIHGNYDNIETIQQNTMFADLNQVVSFILGLAILYGDWNIVEENELFLESIIINFPFDSSLVEFESIILNMEDVLLKNKIYNELIYYKKGNFIWKIYDWDLLKLMSEFVYSDKRLKKFLNIDKKIRVLGLSSLEKLKSQLHTDLRLDIDKFKLTTVKNVIKN